MKNQLSYLTIEQQPERRLKVRDLPTSERPFNRLREVGPKAISTTEVLACLLQTSDALHQAQELLVRFDGLVDFLHREVSGFAGVCLALEGDDLAVHLCVEAADTWSRGAHRVDRFLNLILEALAEHVEESHFNSPSIPFVVGAR